LTCLAGRPVYDDHDRLPCHWATVRSFNPV
jgi:hypothetical protein